MQKLSECIKPLWDKIEKDQIIELFYYRLQNTFQKYSDIFTASSQIFKIIYELLFSQNIFLSSKSAGLNIKLKTN